MDKTALRQGGREVQFCTFNAGDKLYGIEINCIKEISADIDLQSIPHTSGEIGGYVNIRGQIFLIIDLRQLLGEPKAALDEDSRLILFKQQSAELLGILVDCVREVVACNESSLEITGVTAKGNDEELSAAGMNIISSVCMWREDIINIISITNLREYVEQIVSCKDGIKT